MFEILKFLFVLAAGGMWGGFWVYMALADTKTYWPEVIDAMRFFGCLSLGVFGGTAIILLGSFWAFAGMTP